MDTPISLYDPCPGPLSKKSQPVDPIMGTGTGMRRGGSQNATTDAIQHHRGRWMASSDKRESPSKWSACIEPLISACTLQCTSRAVLYMKGSSIWLVVPGIPADSDRGSRNLIQNCSELFGTDRNYSDGTNGAFVDIFRGTRV